jgi:hypothetical protein
VSFTAETDIAAHCHSQGEPLYQYEDGTKYSDFKCSKDLTKVLYHLRMISSLIMNPHHASSLQDENKRKK